MRRPARSFALLAVSAVVLVGCAEDAPGPVEGVSRISVVATTNVYGSIAEAIGGDHVEVTSIITSAAQDPHSYEASAQDSLAISHAAIVIENGGGYDPFIDTLLEASGAEAVVVNAVDASGLQGGNEHVWYSLQAMDALAWKLASELADLDPVHTGDYADSYDAFAAELAALEERANGLYEIWEGTGVAITEPVPLYLLAELGLVNLTPDEFSEAIEEGSDVPPLVLQETLGLFEGDEVALLAYNGQTAGRETEQLRAAADAAGVPVVSLTETLPDGADYLSWMADNITAIEAVLE